MITHIATIFVSQKDIDTANRLGYGCHPVALAVKQNTNSDAAIGVDYVYFMDGTKAEFGVEADSWMKRWSKGERVRPFKFDLYFRKEQKEEEKQERDETLLTKRNNIALKLLQERDELIRGYTNAIEGEYEDAVEELDSLFARTVVNASFDFTEKAQEVLDRFMREKRR